MTSPPSPPSPPFGPPRGTNFSRRKLMQPSPPPPPRTRIFAWSMIPEPFRNLSPSASDERYTGACAGGDRHRGSTASGSVCCRCSMNSVCCRCSMNTDTPVFFASVLKLDHAINQGKKRIVPPNPDVAPRFERCPTLPYQNAARRAPSVRQSASPQGACQCCRVHSSCYPVLFCVPCCRCCAIPSPLRGGDSSCSMLCSGDSSCSILCSRDSSCSILCSGV